MLSTRGIAPPGVFFFFKDTATTEIYTLSLHDALPISPPTMASSTGSPSRAPKARRSNAARSEEHTSELQSRQYLVCRLLLEKKKKDKRTRQNHRRKKKTESN